MDSITENGALTEDAQGFDVIETDDIEASSIAIEEGDDAPDERTLLEVYEEATNAINDARDDLIKVLSGAPSDTTLHAWRSEKNAVTDVKNGVATPREIEIATAVATAGGETLDQYVTKVLAKAAYLEKTLVMIAAALVRSSIKRLEAAYSEAKAMDEAAGIEHVEAVLSAVLEDAYSQAESHKATVAQ